MKTARCPRCNVKGTPQGDVFWCRRCQCLFDDEPAEGGDYSDRNPAARLEREERQRQRGPHRRRT